MLCIFVRIAERKSLYQRCVAIIKNKHFCDCRCNRELLEKHPELFVTKGSSSTKKTETRILTARQKNGYEQRLRRIISIIEQKCDKQTYRVGKLFICYACQETKFLEKY